MEDREVEGRNALSELLLGDLGPDWSVREELLNVKSSV
jgi:hypothetical protein